MNGRDEKHVAAAGAWGTVEYAVRSNGKRLAEEFIDGLPGSDQTKLAALFRRMADSGIIRNREKFRKVAGDIYEFKSHQIRIGCFLIRRTWFLTHGFIKKKDKWEKSELERANAVRAEHLDVHS
ncbi:MAG: type II toxin-antitoxin system RelE/ParE family toxin [Thermoguttaceae bacterium]|jgi:hypothetical protein